MTDHEIAQTLTDLIDKDAKRPPQEQVQDLIDAGVIDEQGRVLIGNGAVAERVHLAGEQNVPSATTPVRKLTGT